MKLIGEYYEDVVSEMKKEVKLLSSKESQRLCLTLHEHTSLKNRRYLNIYIHASAQEWNLGLIRISDSLTAEKILEIIEVVWLSFG